jgi:AraC-like DNA-binding protein
MENYYLKLTGWMIPMCRAIESTTISVVDVLQACEIDINQMEDQESQIAIEKFSNIIDYCNKSLDRNDFAILVSKQFHPGSLHILSYAMMASSSLKNALNRLAYYKRILSNTCQLEVHEKDDELLLNMEIFSDEQGDGKVLPFNSVVAFLSAIVTISRQLLGEKFSPKKLTINYDKPDHDTHYLNDFFNCEVNFNPSDKVSSLTFDFSKANEKLLSGSSLMTQVHEKVLDELMSRLDKTDLLHTVRCKIFENIALGVPSQTKVAQQIGMSLRNLQRKLHDQGTSYKEILDHLRKKLVFGYIKQRHLSLNEISYLAGYNSVGNFNRAFRRWTDTTPGEYRDRIMTTGSNDND